MAWSYDDGGGAGIIGTPHRDADGIRESMCRRSRHRSLRAVSVAFMSVALATGTLSAIFPKRAAASGASQLVFTTQPGNGDPGVALATQPVVTIEDSSGNAVSSSSTVSLTLNRSAPNTQRGTLSCAENPLPASNGIAGFQGCEVDYGGLYTMTATDSTDSLSATSAPFYVSGPAQLAFVSEPGGGPGGTVWSQQPAVAVEDADGNVIAGSSVQLGLFIATGTGTTGAYLSCSGTEAAVNGVASFQGCSVDKAGTNYSLVAYDSTDKLVSADSQPFDITAGSASKLAFTAEPAGAGSGGVMITQPEVTVEDAGGNPAAGNSDQITLSLTSGTGTSGASLSCTSDTVAAVDGVADFAGCAIDKPGTGYTLTATDSAAGLSATSAPFDVVSGSASGTVGPPAQLVFATQPGGGTGGTVWSQQPVVAVEDANGNVVTTSTASIELSVTSGTGPGTLSCTDDPLPVTHEAAYFSGCRIDRAGSSYTLSATDPADGLSTVSQSFAVSEGPPSRLSFTTQPGNALAGQLLASQPVVAVEDAGGNVIATSTASIRLSVTAGTGASGAVLSCAGSVSAFLGSAQFSRCAIDQAAGGYTLTATDQSDGLSAESLPFSVELPPPQPLGNAPTGIPLAQTFGGTLHGANPTDVSDDVNSATGALTFSVTDLKVAGIGEPLTLTRTYNSADDTGGVFGTGWTSLLDASVQILGNGTAVVRGEDGQQLVWTWDRATHTWTPPPGARETLDCWGDHCTVTLFDGVRWDVRLDSSGTGRITDYLAADGEGLRFSWSSGKVVITIDTTNRAPYEVIATLDTAGQVTSVTTPAHRAVSYGYTGSLLTSVTDARGNTWRYTYNASALLTKETDPDGNVRLIASYDPNSGRVTAVSKQGSSQHTDDTFTWDSATQTATRWVLTDVDGALTPEPYVDHYSQNVLLSQTLPSGAVMRYSYDAQVELVELQDPQGMVETFTYDADHNLVTQSTPITSKSASTVTMTYDQQHRVTSQTDADGNTTRYFYSGPYLVMTLPPGGGLESATWYFYNRQGELAREVTPTGQQVYSYDAAGNRTRTLLEDFWGRSLNGNGTLATYDEAGNMLTSVDARGTTDGPAASFTTTWKYDAVGNLLSTTTPGGQTTSYTYDKGNDVTEAVDAAGNVTDYTWNESALTRTTTTNGGTETQTYDPSGHLLSDTTSTNRTTTYVYDEVGEEIQTTNPANVTTFYTYDIEGNGVEATDSTGNVVTHQFNSLNELVRTVNDGTVTLTGYDPAGNTTSTTDAGGSITTTTYTPRGQVAAVTNAAGTTSYSYDAGGNLVAETDPDGHRTTYTYDAAGRKTSMTVAGATTTYGYDAAGNLVRTTDPDGRTTSYTLDGLNRPTRITYTWAGHQTITVTEAYDALGRRVELTDPTGTHSYTYDAAGDLTSETTGKDTFSYDYSQPGEVIETYPDGTKITYSLDDAQNLMSVQEVPPDSSGSLEVSYIRNAQRQTTGIAYSNGIFESQQLDQSGNILDQTLTMGGTTIASDGFSYDSAGNRLTQTDTVDGVVTTDSYGYDATGRLVSFSSTSAPAPQISAAGAQSTPASSDVSSELAASPASATSTSVWPSSQSSPSTTTPSAAPSGTAAGTSASTSPASPASETPALAGLAPLFTGATGNPGSSSPTSAAGSASQASGAAAGPLTGATGASTSSPAKEAVSPTYSYDPNGNRLSQTSTTGSTTYTYNSADELTSETGPSGTTTYTYDRSGNVTSIKGPTGTETFTYDAADHLVGVTSAPGVTVTYTYDGDGNRVSETVNGVTTEYLWDPAASSPQLAMERTSTGALVRRYIYGDGPVAMQTSTQTFFYHLDPLGSVMELSDSAGNIVAAYQYDGFGNVTITGTSPPSNPLLFQGEYLDAATGLYNMGARNYDPATGRFLQREPNAPPVGAPDVSPYVFVGDRPTVFTDPTGQSWITTVTSAVTSAYGWSKPYLPSHTSALDADDVSYGATGASVLAGAFAVAGFAMLIQSSITPWLIGPLAIAGIALTTYVTVLDCKYGSTAQCAADVTGIVLTLATIAVCSTLSGGNVLVCGFLGAVVNQAVQFAIKYVIINYGPQIASAFVSGYEAVASGAKWLYSTVSNQITNAASEAGGAIATGFNKSISAISSGFEEALDTLVQYGRSAEQIAALLANEFHEGLTEVVNTLAGLSYHLDAIAQAIATQFKQSADELAELFKQEFNYAASEVASALSTAFAFTDEEAAAALASAGYAASEVAEALGSVYGDGAQAVADALEYANYSASEVEDTLSSLYNETTGEIESILSVAGYATSVIDNLGGDFSSFGDSVANFFESWF